MRGKLTAKQDPPRKIGGSKPGERRGNAGKGRPKGAKNKTTKALKEMILGALDDAGGQSYLQGQAKTNPNAFLALVGKVLPTTLAGSVGTVTLTPEQADRIEHDD